MSGPSTRSGRLSSMQHEQSARAKWTSSLTKVLVDLMADQIQQRNSQKITFNNKWKYICDEFYSRTGLRWDKEQLKYRCAVLKKLYCTVKSLLDQGEFCWDESTGAIKANDEVWDQYIKEHPDADTLRASGCPIYKQLCIVFTETGKNENTIGFTEKGGVLDPMSNVTEDCSTESEEVACVTNEQEKPKCVYTPHPVNRKRGRKGFEDTMADAIFEMAAASRMRAEAIQQCSQRFTISKCVDALDELQGIDEKVYFAALDLFNNPIAREMFLSLKAEKRLMWLQSKCKLP
ncbi:L10-interacting MYB domain-containing protein isoform X2 [Beta vulgaris subsp. vulgaris]|nr:L10-interacting MYB domain-containing protein isoform X2 [Beta vulgaris subsp. vulgaris]